VRAPQNLAVQHPRQLNIGAVSGGTRDLLQRVVTGGPGAQHVVGASVRTRLLSVVAIALSSSPCVQDKRESLASP